MYIHIFLFLYEIEISLILIQTTSLLHMLIRDSCISNRNVCIYHEIQFFLFINKDIFLFETEISVLNG